MTPTTTAPDQSKRASGLIELWLELDRESQNETLARLIAASIHPGVGSALERFAGTGRLDGPSALDEIDDLRVPLDRDPWIDALSRFVLYRGGRS